MQAAACATTTTCARSSPPGPPEHSWPRRCTTAASPHDQRLTGSGHPVGHVAILDANDPAAHRAEQRLDDDVASELLERSHRRLVALADDRRRSGHTGAGEECTRPRFVDGALERAGAVDAADAVRR